MQDVKIAQAQKKIYDSCNQNYSTDAALNSLKNGLKASARISNGKQIDKSETSSLQFFFYP